MNKKNIIKPMTLMKEDFVQNLVDLCNKSGLPFFMVESILKDLVQDVHTASLKQLEADKQKYNQELLKLMSQNTPDEKDDASDEKDGD